MAKRLIISMHLQRQHGRQDGQAMVEFVVAALFFLVPLFLAISVLGKFSDVQHTAEMAGRYSAWERTVWYQDTSSNFNGINSPNKKTSQEIHNEIAVRLFNDRSTSETVIKSTDKSATTFVNGTDPMWRDNAGAAYLDDFAQLTLAGATSTPPSDVAGQALSAISAVSIPNVLTIAPPLPSDTLAVDNIVFNKIAKKSAAYQRLWPKATVWIDSWEGLEFKSTSAILSNTWYANGSTANREMVATMVPTAQNLGSVLELGVVVGMRLWDPFVNTPDLGRIAVDVVPNDRLR